MIAVIGGAPGIGKTTFAVHWGHQVADRFPDGQLYVNLHGFDPTGSPTSPMDALRDLLESLGVRPQQMPATLQARAGMYRSVSAGRRVLVVLDNARDADQVGPLLPGGAGCMVLVTSRDRLSSLVAHQGAHPITLDVLSAADSTELLASRLGTKRLAAEPTAVTEIVDGCGRLPLALTIVATRAAIMTTESLARLAAQLRDERTRLQALDAGEPATDVRAVFAWSYRWLHDPAARMFRLLGLHPGADIGALAATSLAGMQPEEARRSLRDLVRANLVQETLPDRYMMHDLLRAYARSLVERHETEQGQRTALNRLLNHYVYAAAAARQRTSPHEVHRRPRVEHIELPCPTFADDLQARAWQDAERRNLVATSGYAAANRWPRYAIDLGQVLYRYFLTGGHHTDAELVHRSALRSARACADPAAEASATCDLAIAYWQLGRTDIAIDHLLQAIPILTDLGDDAATARAYNNLGVVYQTVGRPTEAREQHDRAVSAFRRAGDQAGANDALGNLGIIYWLWGRYKDAIEHFQLLLASCRELNDRNGIAIAAGNLGTVYQRIGRYDDAIQCHRQALAIYRQTGNPAGRASALTNMAIVDRRLGSHESALDHFRQALAIYTDLDDHERIAETRAGIILSLQALEQWDEANRLLDDVLTEYALSRTELGPGTRNGFATALTAAHRLDVATEWHNGALEQARSVDDRYEAARALDGLATIMQQVGRTPKATEYWTRALNLYSDLGVPEAGQVRATMNQLAPNHRPSPPTRQ